MKLKRKDLRKLINEMVTELDKITMPSDYSMSNRDRYDASGKDMGYSPVQDLDKIIAPLLTSTVTVINPMFGAFLVGSKTVAEAFRDISELYNKDKTKEKANFKKQLKKYVADSGIDKAIGSMPVGKYLQKIPGYKSLKGAGKEAAKAIFEEIEGVIHQETSDSIKSNI